AFLGEGVLLLGPLPPALLAELPHGDGQAVLHRRRRVSRQHRRRETDREHGWPPCCSPGPPGQTWSSPCAGSAFPEVNRVDWHPPLELTADLKPLWLRRRRPARGAVARRADAAASEAAAMQPPHRRTGRGRRREPSVAGQCASAQRAFRGGRRNPNGTVWPA